MYIVDKIKLWLTITRFEQKGKHERHISKHTYLYTNEPKGTKNKLALK